jgi:chromosome segregation ATPase
MPPTTESEIKELRDLVMSQREEMRLGFAGVKNDIQRVEAKADTKFAELHGDIKALDQKVTGMDDRLRSQDEKLNQIGSKLGEVNLLLAEMKGDLKIVKQPIEFWEFVKRAVVSGLTVTVAGGLLLAAWKLVIFGTI